ncbi:toprim domain-containing protein [Achromobacter spanius]|uniref:Toprim domain-containing protein n=2 Tax=Achromobacter spanius TaxID=217203 RepID=A0AA42S7C1_9BURK|nr:toprim domain-containing protein [Achromobacter spanius]MDH0740200.1 toprim domain-containing protein [Achromobacter spanius]
MQTFSEFARACGVLVGDLYPSDRIRRCATTAHERSKNGAYFWDGQRGWVMAWDGDGEVHWYGGEFKPWTDEEKREWARKRDADRQRRVARQIQAARQAETLLRSCIPLAHGYLHRKGFPDAKGLVAPDDALVIPMRDVLDNRILGVQTVRWDATERAWVKRMATGMRATGAVLRIGSDRALETVLCEGYATGLSIDAAIKQLRLNAAVLVCFSDSNMRYAAAQVPGKKYAFADNDKSGAGERAAKEAGLAYCMSDVIGEDANDLHMRAGVLPVAMKLMAARRTAMGA